MPRNHVLRLFGSRLDRLGLLACVLLVIACSVGTARAADVSDPGLVAKLPAGIGELPVLHQGRVKPLSVAAEEIVYAITGYGRFAEVETVEDPRAKGVFHQEKTRTAAPVDLLVSLMLARDAWHDRPLLYAPFLPLQKQLGLRGQWASIAEVEAGRGYLGSVFAKKQRAEATKERIDLSDVESEAYTLAGRQSEAQTALDGDAIALLPLAPDAEGRAWALAALAPRLGDPAEREAAWRGRLRAVQQLPEKDRDAALARADIWLTFGDLAADDALLRAPAGADASMARDDAIAAAIAAAHAWIDALRHEPAAALAAQSALVSALRAAGARRDAGAGAAVAAPYPSGAKIATEVAYQRLHPFTWAWICYIAGGILTALGLRRAAMPTAEPRPSNAFRLGVALTLIGMLCNLSGLGIRVYITSLGAVTNLYETLVYVALLAAGLGLGLAYATRNGLYAVAGGLAGGLCAMVGEAIPPDLGSHIGQLQPVLRSKFWLWTHVKTVVASYAAFLLAWAMGNLVLIRAAIQRRNVTQAESLALYRSLQVGVVLIAAGTLLGAVWASKAWGRFWGWDPKEVWALVILLTYLIPLHLRYVGLVGPNGLAAWSVYGFMSVVMSWYGVNFLLGTGLHAYAFGSGGQEYVLSLCAVQIVATTVLLVKVSRQTPARAEFSAANPPPAPAPLPSAESTEH